MRQEAPRLIFVVGIVGMVIVGPGLLAAHFVGFSPRPYGATVPVSPAFSSGAPGVRHFEESEGSQGSPSNHGSVPNGIAGAPPRFRPSPALAIDGANRQLLGSSPALGPRPPHIAASPASDPTFYMQEGATLSSLVGGSNGFSSGYMNVTLPASSPYSTGFEFNALSNTGDWYQAVVGYNWPGGLGCITGGFHDIFNWWNNTGASVGLNCDLVSNPSAGDVVALYIYVANSGQVCMEVYDWSNTGNSNDQCVNQPDPGSNPAQNYFVMLPSSSNFNGYFSGPMTEVVDTSASSCGTYSSMPTPSYFWGGTSSLASFDVASYVPWSDEFELGGSLCYYASTPAPQSTSYTAMVGGSTYELTRYFEASGGSTYGPHWVGGQEVPSGWRFQTDVVPLDAPSVGVSPTSLDLGQSVTFSTSALGGTGLYLFGVGISGPLSTVLSSVVWSPPEHGTYSTSVIVEDSLGDTNASLTGPSFTVLVDPAQSPPIPSHTSTDVGQAVAFTASVNGGSGGGSYVWSYGTLTGCPASTTSTLTCTPTAAGTFTVSFQWTDSNGVAATGSTSLGFTVYADPTVSMTGGTVKYDVDQIASSISATVAYSGPNTATVAWYDSSSASICMPTGSSVGLGTSFTPSTSAADTANYCAVVTDSGVVGYSSNSGSGVATVTVYADPTVSVSPGTLHYYVRSTASPITASVTYSGPNTATVGWYDSSSGSTCTPTGSLVASGASFIPSTSLAGTTNYCAVVTDSGVPGYSSFSGSGIVTVTIYADPTQSSPTATPQSSVDIGQTVTFTATVSGGSSGGSYAWSYGTLTGCTSTTSSTLTCAPTGAGTFTVSFQWTDSDGVAATGSTSLSFTVYADPTVSWPTGAATSILQGKSVTFFVLTTPGSGSLTYAWSGLPPGCTPTDASTITCSPTSTGNYNIVVNVTDSNGGRATSSTLPFTVNQAFLGLPATEGYAALGGAIGVVIVVAAVTSLVLLRRRGARRPPAQPASEGQSAGVEPPTPPSRLTGMARM
jgi:hypothetical protein